jgi:uncharacterized protein (UPF0147 family)
MKYSKGEVKEINQRLDMYEKILNEILKNTSVRKNISKKSNEQECKIYLSFAGLNKVCEQEKV